MREARPFEELNIDDTGHALISPSIPDDVIQAFMSVLTKCSLPKPFPRGTKLSTNRWMPKLDDKITFPLINWKIIHTVPSSATPREIRTHEFVASKRSMVSFQMKFNHIVQFNCIAATQEEATAIEWWLVRQLFHYRHILADAGAQHLRYHERREDDMAGIPVDKYPVKSVRFSFQTVMTFQSLQVNLQKVFLKTFFAYAPIYTTEIVTKGEDTLEYQLVAGISSVTNQDETVTYDPGYDKQHNRFVWLPDQLQPADGEQYVVNYFRVGTELVEMSVETADIEDA